MPALLRRINHKKIVLGPDGPREHVGVYTKQGHVLYWPWLGFIGLRGAQAIPGSIPVKLSIDAYSLGDGFGSDWVRVDPDRYVQGCVIEQGAFGVLTRGVPRLVP